MSQLLLLLISSCLHIELFIKLPEEALTLTNLGNIWFTVSMFILLYAHMNFDLPIGTVGKMGLVLLVCMFLFFWECIDF